MPKLSDTQLLILSAAAQRDDRAVEPPATATASTDKAARQLLKRGLLGEVAASDGMPAWRRDEADGAFALIITPAGLEAIGVADNASPEEARGIDPAQADAASKAPARRDRKPKAESVTPAETKENSAMPPPNQPREGSKLGAVITLLQRSGGASIAELTKTTGWLPHTARAAVTGLRKRGYLVETERKDGATFYRIVSTAPQKRRGGKSKPAARA